MKFFKYAMLVCMMSAGVLFSGSSQEMAASATGTQVLQSTGTHRVTPAEKRSRRVTPAQRKAAAERARERRAAEAARSEQNALAAPATGQINGAE